MSYYSEDPSKCVCTCHTEGNVYHHTSCCAKQRTLDPKFIAACPFCGEQPELRPDLPAVECDCGARMYDYTIDKACMGWNMRRTVDDTVSDGVSTWPGQAMSKNLNPV